MNLKGCAVSLLSKQLRPPTPMIPGLGTGDRGVLLPLQEAQRGEASRPRSQGQ